ncbi:hypothetical protein K501DRAFT_251255 [Backusella circina FSU 941]|nr:hypothetical protein K501DRAFT_251255 [Backusella circina FSU 941]
MTLLTKITDDAINENLEKRWKNGEIYTYIGNVLISVNPFKDLGIYTDDVLENYRGKNLLEVSPHVFAIAESSYHHMNSYKDNQCIIISGESGAGKTEAAKRIMQYIAAVSEGKSTSIQEIKDMVLATNPLLESFGCAKTLRNNNSSRHGKYLEIQFNPQGEPVGAVITNYLLEKNRVVGQIQNERNFHIFYQLTKGASAEYKEQFGLQGPDSYLYTSTSNCLDVEGINDVNDYQETINAMLVIGLDKSEQDNIFKMLAVVLWLGNVVFTEDEQGHAVVIDEDVINFIAYLLQVNNQHLNKVLTHRIMEAQHGGRRGSIYEVPLNLTQASSVRDALAKSIYERLFEWIVARVNQSLQARAAVQYTVGVLDIYGFEIFDTNHFEQLCINYVNEKLQQIFIELTLKTEQEEYVHEKIEWTPIQFFDNKVVCDLIEAKQPPGIFAALNDACATAHADPNAADSSFVQRLEFLSSNPHFESRGNQFLIRHYAGNVLYNIQGITDKNKDALLKDLLELLSDSKEPFVSSALFPERVDPNSKRRPPTAGDKIKASCNALVEKLMRCHPSYIRTIKPNDHRSSTEYDNKRVHHQIKYLGLCENIRVRRAGFAYRTVFDKFVERFYLLCPATGYAGDYIWQGDAKSGSLEILKYNNIPKDEWQMGTSKIFIKHPETIFGLEGLRDRYWHNMATRIQRAWRAYVRHKHECATKIQRFWRQNKYNIGYLQLRENGNQLLAGKKERRRFSLVSQRAFLGDYLDVQNGSIGLAAMIRRAINLKGNEQVEFSMRGSMLVPRAMRSSIPSPRTFVLTNQSFHIVMATKNGNTVQMVDEKAFSLNVIRSVSLSTLRDDWVVLHLDGTPDGDCVISCVFKTELATRLSQTSNGRIKVDITSQIQYRKKGNKTVTMKFIKDNTIRRDDVYKSHVVRVPAGEPPNIQSRMGPLQTTKNHVISQSIIRSVQNTAQPNTPCAPQKQTFNTSRSNTMSPKPIPPPKDVHPSSSLPLYKALYPFKPQQDGELSFVKDDAMEIAEKDDNGWWLARMNGKEGWVPSNYLEPCTPHLSPARRRPPPPIPTAVNITPVQNQQGETGGFSSLKSGIETNQQATHPISAPVHVAKKKPPIPGPKPSTARVNSPPERTALSPKISSKNESPAVSLADAVGILVKNCLVHELIYLYRLRLEDNNSPFLIMIMTMTMNGRNHYLVI